MRLGLIGDPDSRAGGTDTDAAMFNVIAESDEGATLAVIRPAVATVSSNSGNGNGLVRFNGVLISVFGTTLGSGETPTSIGTVTNGHFDFAAGPL